MTSYCCCSSHSIYEVDIFHHALKSKLPDCSFYNHYEKQVFTSLLKPKSCQKLRDQTSDSYRSNYNALASVVPKI